MNKFRLSLSFDVRTSRKNACSRFILALAAFSVLAPQAAMAEGFKLLSLSTLVGQIITFSILVWVVMKFVWPPLMNAIETRQKEIADGLAAAEQGKQSLADADSQRDALLSEARKQAGQIVSEGEQRRNDMIATARTEAEAEKSRILEQGRRDLELERAAMARDMQQQVGMLAASAATQIVGREVNEATHADILDSLKAKLQS